MEALVQDRPHDSPRCDSKRALPAEGGAMEALVQETDSEDAPTKKRERCLVVLTIANAKKRRHRSPSHGPHDAYRSCEWNG